MKLGGVSNVTESHKVCRHPFICKHSGAKGLGYMIHTHKKRKEYTTSMDDIRWRLSLVNSASIRHLHWILAYLGRYRLEIIESAQELTHLA